MGKKFLPEKIEFIRHLYVDLEYSTEMINAQFGVSHNAVRRYMTRMGFMRSLGESRKLAVQKGRLFPGSKPGKESHGWKGGRSVNSRGYIKIYVASSDPFYIMADRDHYIMEHRYTMAQHLNRPLTSDEFIHHLNGVRTDNRLKNLALVSRNNHPNRTFLGLIQRRVRELEATLAQQKLEL